MRILLLLAAWLLLATFAPVNLHRPAMPPPHATLMFEPVALYPGDEQAKRVGGLVYLGGWSIKSNDFRFGGISAMHVGEREILAVSDAGSLFAFARPDRTGAPALRIGALPDGPGSALRKSDRDAEAMAVQDGHVWIGFERSNAVWRYAREDMRPEASAAPPAMRKWRANSGSEAMLRLGDGRFLIFSEGNRTGRTSEVLLFDGDPAAPHAAARRLRYRPPEGYRITDAALLPDGRLLFLNRRFAWFEGISAKLGIARPPKLDGDSVLSGIGLADLRAPATIDNMEALSVTREQGRTIVWIASDNNFNPLQRTLLLKFALTD